MYLTAKNVISWSNDYSVTRRS